MCWPVTPRRVAGLDGGDTVTHRPSHAQPYGDCTGGPWSLGRPAADGGDFELSAPLITGLTPLPYPRWTGREWLAANMCECKDTEADQRQVKLLEGSGHLGPRRKRKALWGCSYCMNLCLPWALPCVTGRSTFDPRRHISALVGLPLQRAGGWKQKENSLGKICPTQGPDLAHLESPLSQADAAHPDCHIGGRSSRRATCTRACVGAHPAGLWTAGLGRAMATQGTGTRHMPNSWAWLEGKVCWRVAKQTPVPGPDFVSPGASAAICLRRSQWSS